MDQTGRCVHCQSELPPGEERFCCAGCRAANELITSAGLDRYYELRGGPGTVVEAAPERSEVWLEACAERLARSGDAIGRVELDVQGVRCAACVWVIEKIFERQPGGCEVLINPGAGKLSLDVRPGVFDLAHFARDLRQLGYRLGPASKRADAPASRALLLRLGVCAALTMNVMIFTFAIYAGLAEGPIFEAMLAASWVMSAAAVAIGGWPFFRSGFEAVRHRTLHLDVPIALGIGLAFVGSTYSYFSQRGSASYFDTVATFVTLMLVGRFLQERVLEQNRRALLADDGVENLYSHLIEGEQVRVARVGEIKAGARLLVRPGELVPVDARLEGGSAAVSREWITGESKHVPVQAGEVIEAGCFVVGERAAQAEALGDYASSRLSGLLRAPRASGEDRARRTPFWAALSRWYVALTLLMAAGAGGWWWWVGRSPERAVEVVVAILVVTCPCAFGIAVPVAYELAQAALRRGGVFVRSPSLLERASQVRKVVFDKTGTLTLGELQVDQPEALAALPEGERRVLWNLAMRSSHPKSRAVAHALRGLGLPLVAVEASELPGKGLEATVEGRRYRLGAPGWAGEGPADLLFSVDGAVLLAMTTSERARHDALGRIDELREEGREVHLLSGDTPRRVEQLAKRLRIDPALVQAAASPEDKRRYVASLGGGALMVGDGVNDAAAMAEALCSATPAGDLPFLPSRTDAYIQGELVTGVRRLLVAARKLHLVVREVVAFGVAYNVLAVVAAAMGLMSPLIAAVIMPLSSVAVVSYAVARLRGIDRLSTDRRGAAPTALASAQGAA